MPLNAQHAEALARFRISQALLDEAGVRSVSDFEARDLVGLNGNFHGEDLSGIAFPCFSPVDSSRTGARVRLDAPLADGGKYISEVACRHLFFPAGVSDYLRDAAVTAVIVEAEKSALTLLALSDRTGTKLLPIAIGGCWGWKRTVGKRSMPDGSTETETGPSPDFHLFTWNGRQVLLAFDSNASENPDVCRAGRALVKNLTAHGAHVMYVEIPADAGVNGSDDFLAAHSDAAMFDLLNSAASTTITIRVGEIPDAVNEAEQPLLGHAEKLKIFQRACELVLVIRLPEARRSLGLKRPAGTVLLEPLIPVALREVFEAIVWFRRWIGDPGDDPNDPENYQRIDCPVRIALTYCARTGA